MQKQRKNALLRHAAGRAAAEGSRWTDTRADVYGALLDAGGHISAYQLIDKLAAQTGRDVKAPSVYRALDALCALGLAVRIESLNAFRACAHPEEDHQHVFLVCDGCGHTDEIADHGIGGRLAKDAAAHGFTAARQVLELHGSCSTCTKTA
jgi:Fur family zinc uptake transcriptional regulator